MTKSSHGVVIISWSKGTISTSRMPKSRRTRSARSSGELMRGQGIPVTTSLGRPVKGEDRRGHAPAGGLLHRPPQQGGMAQMDSVKEAQGNDFFL